MSNKPVSTALVPTNLGEAQSLAAVYAKSSLLPPDLRGKEADVFVTIMAGHELGLAPMAALRSIHVVKGKPILSADAMVGVALSSGVAEYFTCIESTATVAVYETKRRGSPHPTKLAFTIDEAKVAGLANGDNWKKYPAAMLRARAKAALARDVYPDALAGVYTEDEAKEFADGPRAQVAAPAYKAPEQVIDAEVVEDAPDPRKALADGILAARNMPELEAAGAAIKAAGLTKEQSADLRALYATHKRQIEQLAAQSEADEMAAAGGEDAA